MAEHFKVLIVILGLSGLVFACVKAPACFQAMAAEDFKRRRNLWLAVTASAFLAPNYWIHAVLAGALVAWYGTRRDPNPPALFLFLLFAIPPFPAVIPGMGLVNYLMEMDYPRLLALVLLLPAWLALRNAEDGERFGSHGTDLWLTAYLVLMFLVQWSDDTFTNALRFSVYDFLGAFLPYYVMRRRLRELPAFRDAAMAFVVAGLVLAICALFEFANRVLLYAALPASLGEYWIMGRYLMRGANLRALVTTGHSLALGYVMEVAMGLMLYLKAALPRGAWLPALLLLLGGLLAPLSRGAWVGTLVVVTVFVVSGSQLRRRILVPGVLGLLAAPLVLISPWTSTVIDYLPFVGTVDADTVAYREKLLDVSLGVWARHPFLGNADYLHEPDMQQLIQGENIIDMVNSYLGVAMASGVVGLVLFVGSFLSVLVSIRREMALLADKEGEAYRLGQTLLAVLAGTMVTIFTVSSITVIPIVYWSVAGIGAAYARMLARAREARPLPAAAEPVPPSRLRQARS